jgi:DNA repair protein RecN (Recombination protein N)
MAELPPLKLERAQVRVQLEPLPENEWGPEGAERVTFEVSTNPGQPFGPIGKIASGGELSRFMLALKVVLARLDSTATLIFDEVDAGIGGATAAAVGERLARLGRERQVLVVTHAPQVAALADHQFSVGKSVIGRRAQVQVRELRPVERRDEIARMLAGSEITEAARAAADSLMQVAGSGA